jgi:hypothetical protein
MENKCKTSSAGADINEKLFDILLKVAAEEVIKEEMDALASCEELNAMYKPSAILEKKVHSIISKASRPYRLRKAMRNFTKIAACFGLLFALSTVVLMSIEASRNHIINIFIGIQDDHVVFEFGQNGADPNISGIIMGYIPESFELINSQAFEDFSFLIYANHQGEQIIITREIASILSVAIDNEIRSFSSTRLNGQQAYLFEAIDDNETNILMWQLGNDVFAIESHININTLFEIARNISHN